MGKTKNGRKTAIPLSCCVGFTTFTISEAVLQNIKNHWLKRAEMNSSRVAGIVYGQKIQTDILAYKALQVEDGEDVMKFETTKSIYCQDKFVGFYSNGNIPEEEDINILHAVLQHLKSTIFLIKFNWLPEFNNVSVAAYECLLQYKPGGENLYVFQTHSYPQCHGVIKEFNNQSIKNSKVFYIDFQSSLCGWKGMPNCKKLRKAKLPSYDKYKEELRKLAEAEGLQHKYLGSDSIDSECATILRQLCKKGNIDVAWDFSISFNRHKNKRDIWCGVKILDTHMMKSGTTTEQSLLGAAFSSLQDIIYSSG